MPSGRKGSPLRFLSIISAGRSSISISGGVLSPTARQTGEMTTKREKSRLASAAYGKRWRRTACERLKSSCTNDGFLPKTNAVFLLSVRDCAQKGVPKQKATAMIFMPSVLFLKKSSAPCGRWPRGAARWSACVWPVRAGPLDQSGEDQLARYRSRTASDDLCAFMQTIDGAGGQANGQRPGFRGRHCVPASPVWRRSRAAIHS